MSLLFKDVADLLEQLYTIKTRDPPYLPKKAEERTVECIANWFRRHRRRINEDNGEALLSTLLPERRTDRVYSIKEKSLEKIIKRVMCLSNERCIDLGRYKEPGAGDLGDCAERVLKQAVRTIFDRALSMSLFRYTHTDHGTGRGNTDPRIRGHFG